MTSHPIRIQDTFFNKLAQYGVGVGLFAIFALFGTIRVLRQAVPGHYRVFTSAARALWDGTSPHSNDFGTGVGYWFYSPSCGLFFFKFFDLFPEKIGLLLFSIFSVAMFAWGMERFFRTLRGPNGIDAVRLHPEKLKQLTYLVVSPILLLGLTASKLEITMTGILLLCSSYLIENRRIALSAFLLSMILIWKYQPLPTIGLICLAWIFARKNFELPLYLGVFSLFWLAVPLTVFSWPTLQQHYADLGISFSTFIVGAWMNFDNLFTFLVHGLGIDMSYAQTQPLAAAVAILFAGGLFLRRKNSFTHQLLYALAFGALFTVTLSPLSQNNSYILLTPFISVALMITLERKDSLRTSSIVRWAFFILVLILSFAYSDLVPKSLKESFRHIGLKPLSIFLFAGMLWANEIRPRLRSANLP